MSEKRKLSLNKFITTISESMVKWSILTVFLASIFSMLFCIVFFGLNYKNAFTFVEIAWVIPAAMLLWCILKAAKWLDKKSEKVCFLLVGGLQVIALGLTIILCDTEPVSDYINIWESAKEMASGTFTNGLTPSGYMYYYNWQLGITAFESWIIKLFGDSFTALKIINAFLLTTLSVIIYFLCKNRMDRQIAIRAYLLSVCFLPWLISAPQFTNHHLGIIFLLASLALLQSHKWYFWLCAGATCACLNVIRPMGIILIITGVFLGLYRFFKEKKANNLINILLLVVSYFVIIAIFDMAFIEAGYTDMSISEARIPYFKFQKGLYGYNDAIYDLKDYSFDYESYNNANKELLYNKLTQEPLSVIIFIINKMVRYLGLFDYQIEMTFGQDTDIWCSYPIRSIYCTGWFQYGFMVLLSIVGFIKYNKKHKVDAYQIFFLGNTLVYIFIEAFTSYRFESYAFLIIWAAVGMKILEESGLNRKNIVKTLKA